MTACVAQGNDVLSALPSDIFEKIFNMITIEDAVTFGTLSHKWRHTWCSHPRLILDQRLFEECIGYKENYELIILEKLPGIVFLHLDGSILKVFVSNPRVPNLLPSVLCTLRHLLLRMVSFDDPDQLSSSLALIRSSPNLETLHIQACSYGDDAKARKRTCIREVATVGIPHLRIVKMFGLRGLKAELIFIGTIISSAPLLETIFLEFKVDKWQAEVIFNSIYNNRRARHNLLIKMRIYNYRGW